MQGLPAPPISSYRVKLALKSIVESGPSTNRKAPITYDLLCYMLQQLQPDMCLLWSAMFCLGFYGALRGSEYSAIVEQGTIRAPFISDLSFTYHQQSLAMIYTIRKSKTKRAPIQVPIGCSNTQCCAVCTMQHYLVLRSRQGTLHANAFLFVDQAGRPITKQQLNLEIKRCVASLGLDTANYTSHSFRSGAATSAHQAGFSETQIKALGHWASSAYSGYIRQFDSHAFDLSRKLTGIH